MVFVAKLLFLFLLHSVGWFLHSDQGLGLFFFFLVYSLVVLEWAIYQKKDMSDGTGQGCVPGERDLTSPGISRSVRNSDLYFSPWLKWRTAGSLTAAALSPCCPWKRELPVILAGWPSPRTLPASLRAHARPWREAALQITSPPLQKPPVPDCSGFYPGARGLASRVPTMAYALPYPFRDCIWETHTPPALRGMLSHSYPCFLVNFWERESVPISLSFNFKTWGFTLYFFIFYKVL